MTPIDLKSARVLPKPRQRRSRREARPNLVNYPVMVKPCDECGTSFDTRDMNVRFCSDRCKVKWFNRAKVRGTQLYMAAMRWRKQRQPGQFGDVTFLLDRWIDQDRKTKLKGKPK